MQAGSLAVWALGLAAQPAALGHHRRLGRHGEDADPPQPGLLRQARASCAASWPKSWSRDDDGAWVFKLRADAVFHNGEPVTADDVKWTIEQIAGEKSTAYMRAQFQSIERIETPDRAHRPPGDQGAAGDAAVLVRQLQHADRLGGARPPNEPIGAGPFRLTAQERGTSIDLAAFDNYYKPGLPKLQGIRFIVYADENLRVAALQSGDVDMIEYVPWQSMAAVEADPRLKLDHAVRAVHGPPVQRHPRPFDDARVRRAVAHAVKRDDIVKVAFFGRGKPLEGVPIAEGTPWYDAELARGWNYDPARQGLLAGRRPPNGFQTVMLATAQFGMHKDTAEVVQQHLAAIGIQCELKLPDWSTRVSLGMTRPVRDRDARRRRRQQRSRTG